MQDIQYGRNYTYSEYLKRFLWWLIWPLFRFSPRVFYGWRNLLLRLFGANIGKGVKIYPSTKIMFPWNLHIGDASVVSWDVILYNLGKITIGSHTIISQYSHICAGNHDYKSIDFKLLKTPISIGDRVWIAADTFVSPGVIIENDTVVLARSVVTRDVPGNTVVGGHPAKFIRDKK